MTRPGSNRGLGARGQLVHGGDCEANGAIYQFTDIVLRRGRGAEAILDAAAARPDCPMIQACGAAYHLLGDTRSGIERAVSLLERARRALVGATDREAMFVDALSVIAQDRPRLADSLFLALARSDQKISSPALSATCIA